jgi:hypothetical protein
MMQRVSKGTAVHTRPRAITPDSGSGSHKDHSMTTIGRPGTAVSRSISEWQAAGFHPHPIIPPGAPLAPNSNIREKDCGKVPGIRRRDGVWVGFDWRGLSLTPENLPTLDAMIAAGAGIGVRTGEGHIWIDCDVLDEAASLELLALTRKGLGYAPHSGRHDRCRCWHRRPHR